MKTYLTLLLICPLLTFAQSKVPDSLKFEMLKATVNFLATDKKISKDAAFKIACNFPNYACLESSIDDNKLKGVLTKVRIWDYKKTGNTNADLAQLKEKIWKDIIASEAKSYRKDLPGFAAYRTEMDRLSKSSNTGVTNISSQEEPDLAVPVTLPDSTETPAISKTKIMEASQFSMFTFIASICAVLLSMYTLWKARQQSAQAVLPVIHPENKISEEWRTEHSNLREEISKIAASLKKLEDGRQSFENRITELEVNKNTLELAVSRNVSTAVPSVSMKDVSPRPTSGNLKFAMFLDVDHIGFSPDMLSDVQNGEKPFEIQISGNKAAYSISKDPSAEKFALTNYEYLTEACEFKGHPQITSRIHTLQPGSLKKAADGNWMIDVKALIEFK